MLMSGLRMEIEWETAAVALKGATADYRILDMQMALDSYTLTDSVLRTLNETAALQGLEVVFASYHNTQLSPSNTGTSLNMEVRKAVSRALGCIMKVHSNSVSEATNDSMASKDWDFTQLQARVGSLYFPQQPLKASTVGNVSVPPDRESYFHTLRGFNKIKTPSAPPAVSLSDFKATMGVFCQDLERSSVQNLTGIPLNNSRTLAIQAEFANAPTEALVEVWLVYTRLCRVFLNNIEVEE
jgi:hypothetical protein